MSKALQRLANYLDEACAPAIDPGIPFLSYPFVSGTFNGRKVQIWHFFEWSYMSHTLSIVVVCVAPFTLLLGLGGVHTVSFGNGAKGKFMSNDITRCREWLTRTEVSHDIGILMNQFKLRQLDAVKGGIRLHLGSSSNPESHIQDILKLASALADSLANER